MRRHFASALADLNDATRSVTTESKFVAVDADDFFGDLAELHVLFGNVGLARSALEKVSAPRSEVSDRISYLDLCLTNAFAAMNTAYDLAKKTQQILTQAWNQVRIVSDVSR